MLTRPCCVGQVYRARDGRNGKDNLIRMLLEASAANVEDMIAASKAAARVAAAESGGCSYAQFSKWWFAPDSVAAQFRKNHEVAKAARLRVLDARGTAEALKRPTRRHSEIAEMERAKRAVVRVQALAVAKEKAAADKAALVAAMLAEKERKLQEAIAKEMAAAEKRDEEKQLREAMTSGLPHQVNVSAGGP